METVDGRTVDDPDEVFRICFVSPLADLAESFAVPFRKIPGVEVEVLDSRDPSFVLDTSRFAVVVTSRLDAPLWKRLVRSGRVRVTRGSRCVVSTVLPPALASAEAHRLGFHAAVDLRQPVEEVIEQLRLVAMTTPSDSVPDQATVADLITDPDDRKIVMLVAAGLPDRDIARWVFLSPQTVRNRISRILSVTGLRNRTQLAVLYVAGEHGTWPALDQSIGGLDRSALTRVGRDATRSAGPTTVR